MTEARRRVAMIGLDAVDLSFVRDNLGSLPNLRRALDTGVTRPLRSTADELAGSVWPTFYTGTRPGQHGIYHHLQWDAPRMQMRRVNEEWMYREPFWYELSRRGLRVVALDVPMSFRPTATGGREIVSWGSHDELRPFSSFPEDLGPMVLKKFGRHPMGDELPTRKTPRVLEQIRRSLVKGARRKGELACWLAREPWDFFIAVFGECHRGGHLLWPADGIPPTALLEVYAEVDRALGSLLEVVTPGADVFVFAVHGMGPNSCQEHLLSHILRDVNRRFTGAVEAEAAGRSFSPIPWLRQRVPPAMQSAIARMVPVDTRDAVLNHAVIDGHDWARTPGLALIADLNGYVRFNVRGREKDGMLDPDSDRLRAYREHVVRCLRTYKLPGGEPLVRDILDAASALPGDLSHSLPDLIVKWTASAPVAEVQSDELPPVRAEPITSRVGNHRPNGFCIELRPDIQRAAGAPIMPIWELGAHACHSLC